MQKTLMLLTCLFLSAGFYVIISQTGRYRPSLNPEQIIRTGGSTTVFPVVRKASREYMAQNSDVIITTSESSSGVGIQRLLKGELEVANSSRVLKDSELRDAQRLGVELEVQPLARDVLAVIVHPEIGSTLKSLSLAQLRSIFFEGKIKRWEQCHPSLQGDIQVFARDGQSSGTAKVFNEIILDGDKQNLSAGVSVITMTNLVVPTVAENEGSIAYSPLKWVDEGVSVLGILLPDGRVVNPDEENIKSGHYPLTRDIYVITSSEKSREMKHWLEYLKGPKVGRIIQSEGFYPLFE